MDADPCSNCKERIPQCDVAVCELKMKYDLLMVIKGK